MRGSVLALCGTFVLGSLAGCSATTQDLEKELRQALKPGVSSLADTLMTFGVPGQVHEDGHIIIYPGLAPSENPGPTRTQLKPPHFSMGDQYPRGATEVTLMYDSRWILTGWQITNPPGIE